MNNKGNYTVPFIVSLIQNIYRTGESRYYKADLTASDMLIDLNIILKRCRLTDKQKYIIERHWIAGYTQEEVAQQLGITQQMVEKHCRAVKKKIRKVLKEMGEII